MVEQVFLAALAAAAVRVDRHLRLAQRETLALAALAGQGGLQALGVLELQRLRKQPLALAAAAAAEGLEVEPTNMALEGLQFR
jgi:hypothetical protein